jgi:hypothetical protein
MTILFLTDLKSKRAKRQMRLTVITIHLDASYPATRAPVKGERDLVAVADVNLSSRGAPGQGRAGSKTLIRYACQRCSKTGGSKSEQYDDDRHNGAPKLHDQQQWPGDHENGEKKATQEPPESAPVSGGQKHDYTYVRHNEAENPKNVSDNNHDMVHAVGPRRPNRDCYSSLTHISR